MQRNRLVEADGGTHGIGWKLVSGSLPTRL